MLPNTVPQSLSVGTGCECIADGDWVLDDVATSDLKDVALVEQDTLVGGILLQEGTFLINRLSQSDESIIIFDPVTSGTTTLIDGNDIGLTGNSARGIELIHETITVGDGYTLQSGRLLMTLGSSDTVGGNSLSVQEYDVFELNVLTGGTTTVADAFMFLDGSDVSLNASEENPFALALVILNTPPTSSDITVRTDQDATYTFTTADFNSVLSHRLCR